MELEALSRIMEHLNQRSQECSQKMKAGLLKESYYKCNKCMDTGWILIPQPDSAPAAVSCECREIERIKNQWAAAGINLDQSRRTFTNFEIWNESSRKAKSTAIAYYKAFDSIASTERNSIMLCGQAGSGKTHVTTALAINFLKRNIKVVYMPYREFMTTLKMNMDDFEFYSKTTSRFKTCDVLLIDDLFKGKINESDINIMCDILNPRYENNLPIIVSTEFSVERLLSFDGSIGSKIYEMCKDYIVEIEKVRENNYRLR